MRRIPSTLLFAALCALCSAQIKVGDNPNTIEVSALLELESTSKGLLIPRVDPASVTSPVAGLLIFDIVSNCARIHNGSSWSECMSKNSTSAVDAIQANLTTSLSAYNAAAAGTWLEITAAEFAALESNLSTIVESGCTDAEFNTTTAGYNWGAATSANAGSPMPGGSYLFAFRYRPNASKVAGDKVKISNSGPLTGFADKGSVLPSHSGAIAHFVLKGNTTPTAAASYLGFYTVDAAQVGFKLNGGVFYELSDAASLPNVTANFQVQMQGLSTTTIQW